MLITPLILNRMLMRIFKRPQQCPHCPAQFNVIAATGLREKDFDLMVSSTYSYGCPKCKQRVLLELAPKEEPEALYCWTTARPVGTATMN